MADRDDSYEVGYKRPPRPTQFVKGQSGNPKGRPKGSQNVSTIVLKAGRERVRVTSNGRTKTITKKEALIKQVVNKALSGEARATREALNLFMLAESREQADLQLPSELSEIDEHADNVVESIFRRMRSIVDPETSDNKLEEDK